GAGRDQLGHPRQLAGGHRHRRRLALRGLADPLVEPHEADPPEPERAALGPRAARLLAQGHARGLVAVVEVDDRHVLPRPGDERHAGHDRGRAERLLRLDLPDDLPVVRYGEEYASRVARPPEGSDGDRAVVARAEQREPTRRPPPDDLPGRRFEREDFAAAGGNDHAAGDDRPGIERVLERPLRAARQVEADHLVVAAGDSDDEIDSRGNRLRADALPDAVDRRPVVVGPVGGEQIESRLPAAARHGGGQGHQRDGRRGAEPAPGRVWCVRSRGHGEPSGADEPGEPLVAITAWSIACFTRGAGFGGHFVWTSLRNAFVSAVPSSRTRPTILIFVSSSTSFGGRRRTRFGPPGMRW